MYDKGVANNYHLVYDDWGQTTEQQADILSKLLPPSSPDVRVLDTSCGIGTQALGLAKLGYSVDGSDLSEAMVERARREAEALGLSVNLHVSDMRDLSCFPDKAYDAVINMVNSIPHLDRDEEIVAALTAMRSKMTSGGVLLISVRDYERDLIKRTTITPPQFFSDSSGRRHVFQIWEWVDDRRYKVHLYVTQESAESQFRTHHFCDRYRAVTLDEMRELLEAAGFTSSEILSPESTGFYQPIIKARSSAQP